MSRPLDPLLVPTQFGSDAQTAGPEQEQHSPHAPARRLRRARRAVIMSRPTNALKSSSSRTCPRPSPAARGCRRHFDDASPERAARNTRVRNRRAVMRTRHPGHQPGGGHSGATSDNAKLRIERNAERCERAELHRHDRDASGPCTIGRGSSREPGSSTIAPNESSGPRLSLREVSS